MSTSSNRDLVSEFNYEESKYISVRVRQEFRDLKFN